MYWSRIIRNSGGFLLSRGSYDIGYAETYICNNKFLLEARIGSITWKVFVKKVFHMDGLFKPLPKTRFEANCLK
ncbi:hypothetical protein QQP08_006692 [Theobroma cacao]|nr:hypothetical protein QQP08_006692 [Theobroma cacao]